MELKDIEIGMRVEAGAVGTDDYDTGEVISIDPTGGQGHEVEVAWDSLSKTWQSADGLRQS